MPGWWLRWRWVGGEWEGGHIGFATLVFQFSVFDPIPSISRKIAIP